MSNPSQPTLIISMKKSDLMGGKNALELSSTVTNNNSNCVGNGINKESSVKQK